jgi:hypothetical protein
MAQRHPLTEVLRQVNGFKDNGSGYLLATRDRLVPLSDLLNLVLGEIAEVIEALEKNDLTDAAKEFSDVLVFVFSIVPIAAPELSTSIPSILYGVNGFGKHDSAWERVAETTQDVQDDTKALYEVLRRIWSIILHNEFAQVGVVKISETLDKVLANYPPQLLTDFDTTLGRISTPEEVLERYTHYVKGLRLIRKDVQRTLLKSDWQPYIYLLNNWQNSEWALQELQAELQIKKVEQTPREVVIYG